MPTLTLDQEIQTARINELPLFSSYGPLTTSDYFVMWLAAFNKTVKIDGGAMYDFMQGVNAGSYTPVILGDKYIYEVPAGDAGGVTANIPTLAGQDFFLQSENGYPYKTDEYEILAAGGFKLLRDGDVLVEGRRYTLSLYSLQAGSASSANDTVPLFVGSVQVASNTTYDAVNHVNKLIQIRGGATKVQFTLPLVDDIPDNTVIAIECVIGNTVEQKVQTQGGQLIYMDNASKTALYMRAGETLWLFRADDGYYVINDFARVYREIASKPQASFDVGLNELVCKGQLLNRADYPRLWEKVQTLGSSLVSDAIWSTATATTASGQVVEKPYRGCFSTGDGSTTFRLPDLMNVALRGVLSETGSDPLRYLNKPGGYQGESVGDHKATVGGNGIALAGGNGGVVNTTVLNTTIVAPFNGGAKDATNIDITTGAETIMQNVGVLWIIKC